MTTEIDLHLPGHSTPWQLWYSDTFDRDSQPSLQASGTNIVQGLYELWFYTLKESVFDNGSASFSRFQLTWGETPVSRVDAFVQPFHNLSLVKLRRWSGFLSQPLEAGDTHSARQPEEQKEALLRRLAELHYEFLQKSDRWKAPAIDSSAEARELLARVESLSGPKEL